MNPEEPDDMSSLPREQSPPAWLEERIVAELKTRGRIHQTYRAHRWLAAAVAAAASFLLFAAGLAAGNYLNRSSEAPFTGPRYILLLYEDAGYLAPKPEESADRVNEYRNWAGELSAQGRFVGGEKLKDAAATLPSDERASSGESGAATLAGYFIISAGSTPEALAIARECPHLRYGGRVVVREIDPT